MRNSVKRGPEGRPRIQKAKERHAQTCRRKQALPAMWAQVLADMGLEKQADGWPELVVYYGAAEFRTTMRGMDGGTPGQRRLLDGLIRYARAKCIPLKLILVRVCCVCVRVFLAA